MRRRGLRGACTCSLASVGAIFGASRLLPHFWQTMEPRGLWVAQMGQSDPPALRFSSSWESHCSKEMKAACFFHQLGNLASVYFLPSSLLASSRNVST